MAGPRRPGRLQRIAYDETPMAEQRIDIDARIGWLLAMSRLHHEDGTFLDGRRFAMALADAGFPASRSVISRWESGEIPISYEGMAAYERALGMEPGRLLSITGYVRAAIPGVRTKVVRPQLDPSSRQFAERLDELLGLAESGQADARHWQDLGWHVSAAAPHVHLRGATWETLARRLVQRLPFAVNVPYRQYSTAAMNLAAVPRAEDFLVAAVESYLADPDVQILSDPLGLLDRLRTREAARLVLDMLEDGPANRGFAMAVWLATQKLAHGHFTAEERSRLNMLVLRLWRADPVRMGEELAELVAILPEGLRSSLTSAATRAGRTRLGYVVEYAEGLPAERARSIGNELAERIRQKVPQEPVYEEDRMLARLLRESLLHRDSERRHLANLLISASPFGAAVTEELLRLLENPTSPSWIRVRAATAVRYLSTDQHRMRMLRYLDDPQEEVAVAVTQGIGHLSFTELSDQAVRVSLLPTWSLRERAKLYALGMTGSPGLQAILRSPTVPDWQRAAARWWVAHGPAITQ